MGPQLLRDAYGADSAQLKTLIQIATHMIADLRAKLQAAYDDRVLMQVCSGPHCPCSYLLGRPNPAVIEGICQLRILVLTERS